MWNAGVMPLVGMMHAGHVDPEFQVDNPVVRSCLMKADIEQTMIEEGERGKVLLCCCCSRRWRLSDHRPS